MLLQRWRVCGLIATLILIGSSAATPQGISENHDFFAVKTQPPNVGDAKIAALRYHDSGEYDRDLSLVADAARRWISHRSTEVRQPAVVFDIDETSLSNWEIIKLDDFGRPIGGPCEPSQDAPCGWAAWDHLGRDPAIEPALNVFRQARAEGVLCFSSPDAQNPSVRRRNGICSKLGFGVM